MNKETNRISWIDYSKGIGIFLVVYGHVLVGLKGSGIDSYKLFFDLSHSIIYSFHMPLFFFLAGLHVKNSLSKRGIKKNVENKLLVILYPYLIWSLITGSIQILLSNFVNSQITTIDLLKILYCPLPDQHYWFLYVLFWMFLSFYFFVATLKKNATVIFLVVAVIIFLIDVTTHIRIVDKFSDNILYFAFGISLDKFLLTKNSLQVKKPNSLILFLIFFVGTDIYYFMNIHDSLPLPKIIFAAMGLVLVILISKYFSNKNIFRFVEKLGFYSIYIYLTHGLFAGSIRIFLYKIVSIENIALHILLGTILGLVLPIILYETSKRVKFPYLFELPYKISDKT